jgi:hypothetical protein
MTRQENQSPENFLNRELAQQFTVATLHDIIDPLDAPLVPEFLRLNFGLSEANCSINDLDPRQALDLLQGLTKLNLNVFACLAEIADDTMKETIKKFTLVTPDLLEKKMNLTATKEERLELAKEYWAIFIERENTTYM